MKILWVTSAFPDARGSGGMVHEFELLRSVASRHEITVLTTFWMIRPAALRAVEELGVRVEVVPWPWQPAERDRNKFIKFVRLLLGAAPTFRIANRSKRLPPLAKAIIREERKRPVDIVFVIQGELAPVLEAAGAPTALLLYDIFSRQTALVSGGLSLRTIRYRLERRNAKRWEDFWYAKANAIACVSPIDAEVASSMLGRDVRTIVNPIPEEFFTAPTVARSANIVSVIGSLGWEPNVDSVIWMCEEIWPRIIRARPDARLRVVGRFGSPEVQRIVEAAGGEYLGEVDDIRPHYWESAVVAANVRMGSGMRNKVLHAMACRAPLVATPSALEGIDAAAGEHLLLAEDAAGLADAIIATLDDPQSAAVRAKAAGNLAARYSAESAGAALESWWETAARRSMAAAPAATRLQSLPSTVSIVVPTGGGRPEQLRRTLASIKAATENTPGTDVIVVEQGEPTAGRLCSDVDLAANVITDHVEGGASRHRNVGLREARGELVLFTDDDCEIPLDWVERHVEAFRDPDVVASFGPVIGIRYIEEYDPVALPARHRLGSPPWIIGHSSNMAVRRAALVEIGGFDERLGPGAIRTGAGEDADVIVRLLRRGWVAVTGTGDPVRHISWRTPEQHRANLIRYEHGAGAWIGKALREEPLAASSYLRARARLVRDTVGAARAGRQDSITMPAFGRALLRGLMVGIRLRQWNGVTDRTQEEPVADRGMTSR